MYKAIQIETGEEIIILHPIWRSRIEPLREMDHADLLVCQGCGQPLRVKAGEVKRPHFAHKHLKACSLGSETAEILLARGVLYEFLLVYFGSGVTLEQQVAGAVLPRPVDCWVETPAGRLAYWLVESGIKIEPREAIKRALTQNDIHPTWIMLHRMLHEEKKLFDSLLLTPTERVFMQVTPFDQALAGAGTPGPSLHYLDAEQAVLTTYRNLSLHHRPNWFSGLKKSSSLAQIFVDRRGGYLIHPGEEQRLQSYLKQQQRLAEKRQQFNQRLSRWNSRSPERAELPFPPDQPAASEMPSGEEQPGGEPAATQDPPATQAGWGISAQRLPADAGQVEPEALVCVQCGQVTRDYWMSFYQGERKLCRCRSCLALMA
jgi:hypothetical protein